MSLGSSAPDPNQVAGAQQNYNLQAGEASQAGSMVNQENPFGSINYSQSGTGPGGVPLYTATTKLSPEMQQILDVLQQNKTTAGTQAGKLLTGANYGAEDPSKVIGDSMGGNVKNIMDKSISYITPYYEQQRAQMDSTLKNQGFKPGDPAYDQAMYGLTSGQDRMVNQALTSIWPEAYKEAQTNYLTPLQVASSEMGLSAPSLPGDAAVQAPGLNVQPANYTDAAYASAKLDQENKSGMLKGLFGIPTAVLGGWAGSPAGGAALTSAMAAL